MLINSETDTNINNENLAQNLKLNPVSEVENSSLLLSKNITLQNQISVECFTNTNTHDVTSTDFNKQKNESEIKKTMIKPSVIENEDICNEKNKENFNTSNFNISQLEITTEELQSYLKSKPIYIYTSLSGGMQIIKRTNRLALILTSNNIKFEYCDLGTNDEAKKIWKRHANHRTLPGVVRGDDIIGDWAEIDEFNEQYKVVEAIYETL